jgi:hypothetical protein
MPVPRPEPPHGALGEPLKSKRESAKETRNEVLPPRTSRPAKQLERNGSWRFPDKESRGGGVEQMPVPRPESPHGAPGESPSTKTKKESAKEARNEVLPPKTSQLAKKPKRK